MRSTTLLALASSLSSALAVYQGFNYGSTQTDGSVKTQDVFEQEFKTAAALVGTNGGFTSARLYTMIQGGTTSDVISAIPAAISTKTSLLLGLWASGGEESFQNEITALKAAISTYGSSLKDLVAGISVGSEDLYRETPTGIEAKAGIGADPDTIVNYISLVREAIKGTSLSGASIGHVDTWNAWTNSSVDSVISAVDWLGVDEYPFFQDTMSNSIDNAKTLFYNAYDAVAAISGGKQVWITEVGWPISGSNSGDAVPSLANAKTFWDEVGCPSFGSVNTWWYTLQDAYPTTPNPSFGIVGSSLTTTPLFDLSCANVSSSSSSAASSSTNSAKASSLSASIVSSARSAASHLPTTGGGLSPSQSNGNGIGGSASATATAAASGVVAGSGSASSTGFATGVSGNTTLSGSPTVSSGLTVATGAASSVSGSMIGAVGAIVALVAAL